MKHYNTPRVGDLAWHKGGLDPRIVTRVEGEFIALDICTIEAFPCFVGNYTFTRPSKEN